MTDWDEAIALFAGWQRAAGHSEGTIRTRCKQLRAFAASVSLKVEGNPDPWSVTLAQCAAWVGRPGIAAETRRANRAGLRVFFQWAIEYGFVTSSPADRLPKVRSPDTMPRPTPDVLYEKALADASDRDRLILLLGALAGLRRAEIAGLRWDQAEFLARRSNNPGHLRIRGKGGKTRIVPLHPDLAQALLAEQLRRRLGYFGSGFRYTGQPHSGFVFPGRQGGHLNPAAVYRAAAVALGGVAATHSLRHRFAQRVYDGTGDLLALQQLLGHAKPETCTRYARASVTALEAAVLAAGRPDGALEAAVNGAYGRST